MRLGFVERRMREQIAHVRRGVHAVELSKESKDEWD